MHNIWKIVFVLSLATMFSCRSSKDLVYLRDAENNELAAKLSVEATQHILKTGDILYISIKATNKEVNSMFNPETNMESNSGNSSQRMLTPGGAYLYGFEIDAVGNINLPMMGKINVSGVSQTEAEAIVQKRADEFINDAIVKVKLLNFRVTVIGEVNSPGIYHNYDNSFTVIQALALAGGSTDYGTIKKVRVIRPFPDGNKTFMLDLTSKDVFLSEAYYLHPNDYIIVHPHKFKSIQINNPIYSIAISTISLAMAIWAFGFRK